MKSFWKYLTLLVLPLAVLILFLGQAEAKKGGGGKPPPDPYLGSLVDDGTSYNSPTVVSLPVQSEGLFGVLLIPDEPNFPDISLGDITLYQADVIVNKKRGTVNGVKLVFYTHGDGIHQTDVISAEAVGDTVQVRRDLIPVYKQKGPGKGTVAGTISVGDVVYTPAP